MNKSQKRCKEKKRCKRKKTRGKKDEGKQGQGNKQYKKIGEETEDVGRKESEIKKGKEKHN